MIRPVELRHIVCLRSYFFRICTTCFHKINVGTSDVSCVRACVRACMRACAYVCVQAINMSTQT